MVIPLFELESGQINKYDGAADYWRDGAGETVPPGGFQGVLQPVYIALENMPGGPGNIRKHIFEGAGGTCH